MVALGALAALALALAGVGLVAPRRRRVPDQDGVLAALGLTCWHVDFDDFGECPRTSLR